VDFKITWTKSAIEDLGSIVHYLALQGGSDHAEKLGFAIFNKVQLLEHFPEIGSLLLEKDNPCWRKLLFKTWKIAYKIDWNTNTFIE